MSGRHSIRHDLHPKNEPRPVELHAIAKSITPFLAPVSEVTRKTAIGMGLDPDDYPSGMAIGLSIVAETIDGEAMFRLVLGPCVDPTEVAGELDGLATTLVRQAAIDLGLDSIEANQRARELTRESRIAARREIAEEAPPNITCDECGRSVFVIVGKRRYCKRHAEAAGVRPHGKIGGES